MITHSIDTYGMNPSEEHPAVAHAAARIRGILKNKLNLSIDELKCLNQFFESEYLSLGEEEYFDVARYFGLYRETKLFLKGYSEILQLSSKVDTSSPEMSI